MSSLVLVCVALARGRGWTSLTRPLALAPSYVPVSGIDGLNLDVPLSRETREHKWYTGPCLLEALGESSVVWVEFRHDDATAAPLHRSLGGLFQTPCPTRAAKWTSHCVCVCPTCTSAWGWASSSLARLSLGDWCQGTAYVMCRAPKQLVPR